MLISHTQSATAGPPQKRTCAFSLESGGGSRRAPAAAATALDIVDMDVSFDVPDVSFEEVVCMLVFVLSFGSLAAEMVRRVSPCYIHLRQSRAVVKAQDAALSSGDDQLEAGGVSSALSAVQEPGRAAKVHGLEGLDESPPKRKIRGPVSRSRAVSCSGPPSV